jgi:DNA-binding MarR family transcriptional regulator
MTAPTIPVHPTEPGPRHQAPSDQAPSDQALTDEALTDAALLARAMGRFVRLATRAKEGTSVSGHGLDMSSVRLLNALAEGGPQRSNSLAEAVLSDPSTISRQVAHLVDVGLVERQPDPDDRRASSLAITPAGSATLAEHARQRDIFLARLTAHWSPDDRKRLPELLDRLSHELAEHLCATPSSTTQSATLEQS